MNKRILIIVFVIFLFTGCHQNEPEPSSYKSIKASYTQKTHGQKTHIQKNIPTQKPYFVHGRWYHPISSYRGQVFTGIASWYGPSFHGKLTASGETYNMYKYTAARKVLPIGTIVRVINLNNNKSVIVRINDRGPFVKNRIIDLSYIAGKTIGIDKTGTAPVKLIVLYVPSYARKKGYQITTLNNYYSKNRINNPKNYKKIVKEKIKTTRRNLNTRLVKETKIIKHEFKKERNVIKNNIIKLDDNNQQRNIIPPSNGIIEQEILTPDIVEKKVKNKIEKVKKETNKKKIKISQNINKIENKLKKVPEIVNENLKNKGNAKIQVGAFDLLEGALRMKNRYKNFRTFIKKEDGVYRVYIGPFTTRAEAENFKERHHIHGFVKTR